MMKFQQILKEYGTAQDRTSECSSDLVLQRFSGGATWLIQANTWSSVCKGTIPGQFLTFSHLFLQSVCCVTEATRRQQFFSINSLQTVPPAYSIRLHDKSVTVFFFLNVPWLLKTLPSNERTCTAEMSFWNRNCKDRRSETIEAAVKEAYQAQLVRCLKTTKSWSWVRHTFERGVCTRRKEKKAEAWCRQSVADQSH